MKLTFLLSFICITPLFADTASDSQQPPSDVTIIRDNGKETKLDYPSLTALILVQVGITCKGIKRDAFKDNYTDARATHEEHSNTTYVYRKETDADGKTIKIHSVFTGGR
jgi:hypothetical protein